MKRKWNDRLKIKNKKITKKKEEKKKKRKEMRGSV